MADLSFIIRADTKELDVAYKKMEQLDKRADELTKKLSSSQPGSKEFAELNKQLSALEKQYESTVKKVAELENKLAETAGKTSKTVTSSTSTEAQAYESIVSSIQQVLGKKNENLALLAKEEMAIKQVALERRTLEKLEKNSAISNQEAAKQRARDTAQTSCFRTSSRTQCRNKGSAGGRYIHEADVSYSGSNA